MYLLEVQSGLEAKTVGRCVRVLTYMRFVEHMCVYVILYVYERACVIATSGRTRPVRSAIFPL